MEEAIENLLWTHLTRRGKKSLHFIPEGEIQNAGPTVF
jgi:hypothetical protein